MLPTDNHPIRAGQLIVLTSECIQNQEKTAIPRAAGPETQMSESKNVA